jgi:hypothetical protein
MDEKLTPFETFSRLKAAQDAGQVARADAARHGDARAGADALGDLVEQTERMVQRLEAGLKRALAEEVASGRGLDEEEIRVLLRRYERLSWHLHGHLRAILHGARKG